MTQPAIVPKRRETKEHEAKEHLPFTKEEDKEILRLYKIYRDWFQVKKFFTNRTAREIRSRYLYLKKLPKPEVPKLSIKSENRLNIETDNQLMARNEPERKPPMMPPRSGSSPLFQNISQEEFRAWFQNFIFQLGTAQMNK